MPSFLPALADASHYPGARVPMTPYLRCAGWPRPSLAATRFGLGRRPHALTVSGRSALGRLARMLRLGGAERVLLPAYHCPSMVEPFMHAGCALDFYAVDAALAPDPDDFQRGLSGAPDLVVFVNFFGFAAAAEPCVAAARAVAAHVVHDCAHAWYALPAVPASDYAIASLVKFFAVEEGGLLLAPAGTAVEPAHRQAGLRRNLRLLSRALARRRAALAPPVAQAPVPRVAAIVAGATATQASAFRYFDPDDVDLDLSVTTRTLLRLTAASPAAQARRRHYTQLAALIRALPGVTLLHAHLPEDVVPYVLPVLLEDGAAQFDAIRAHGIPLYRWEELIPTDCAVSADYRTRLVQLPCHQDLSQRHLDLLFDGLRRSLGQP